MEGCYNKLYVKACQFSKDWRLHVVSPCNIDGRFDKYAKNLGKAEKLG